MTNIEVAGASELVNEQPVSTERRLMMDQRDRDWVLGFYIDCVEIQKSETPVDVTLFLKGTIVTGTIMSSQEYYKNAGMEELSAKFFVSDAERQMLEERLFLHLKNAQFFMGTQSLYPNGGEGFVWRGRLTEIDGFVLGRLSASSK
jgi:hypothetical protein